MTKIERQVMAGVGVIYATRRLTSATALKLYALFASVWALAAFVWVAKVAENFTEVSRAGLTHIAPYLLGAVSHTTIFVQLALLVAGIALVGLMVDLVKSATERQLAFA
jgi:hypothetical protein